MKRILDFIIALLCLVVFSPLFLIGYLIIRLEDGGPAFFSQERVGRDGRLFRIYKFRSMKTDVARDENALVGMERSDDLTRCGRFLRDHHLDELPQLWNVLKGDMSIVGPRPEVRRYVDLYTDEQRKVLTVRPGITDHASIRYINENEILCRADDPERVYIVQIMPDKIKLNMVYIEHHTLREYLRVILLTLKSLLS